MEIKFAKMNPAQNMTILVENDVPKSRHAKIAGQLMDYASVFAEQVGFIKKAKNEKALARLEMMGGEFCGNAIMSLAAFLAIDQKLPLNKKSLLPLESSGIDGLIRVLAIPMSSGIKCALELPTPVSINEVKLKSASKSFSVKKIDLGGISHFIVPEESISGNKISWAEKTITAWQNETDSEAVGLIIFNRKDCSIQPLVLVKKTKSLVWEQGCGSGTAALGAALAFENKKNKQSNIKQPGGQISVQAYYKNEAIEKIIIGLKIKMAARGVAYI